MGARIRGVDWSATPLGPIDAWPEALRTSLGLVLNAQMPMWLGWGEDCLFFYNDAYIAVLGEAKHPSALGRPAQEVWAEIWHVCGPLADRVFQEGAAPFVEDVRLFMDRGDLLEEVYYSFSYSPVRDHTGAVVGLFCPNTEVTAKLLNARRLRTLSELSAKALLERTTATACATAMATLMRNPDDVPFAALYLVDGDAAVLEQAVHVGPGLARERVSLDEPCPWSVGDVFRSRAMRVVDVPPTAELSPGPAGRPVRQAVVLPVTAPGYERPFGVLVAGVNPTRRLDAEYLTFYDLVAAQVATALQNARGAEAERERAEALAALDRAKSAFFTNISHEFRTPLTLMLGPTEDALGSPARALTGDALATVHRNELRLLRLVNALLDFSRLEADQTQLSPRTIDLAAFTHDLTSGFRSAFERAGLAFDVQIEPLGGPVNVDPQLWERIVLNLLSNALKFTFEGRVGVHLREVGGHLELRVSDTGVGIPARELPRLFERFHRVEHARARTHEGSGIGLALVNELARLHGGEVRVDSELGRGTTFTVQIPAVRAAAAPVAVTPTAAAAYVSEAERWLPGDDPADAPPDGDYVLVADDNADMREYLRRLLGEHWRVLVVADGERALAAARRSPPALVLTDAMMPGIDGFQVLAALKAAPETRAVPVILLSARAGEESRVDGLASGADDYLVKPFSARELVARVRTHLELSRARRRSERDYDELFALLVQVPAAIIVRRGPRLRCVFQNAVSLRTADIRGQDLREGDDGPWLDVIERVYASGQVETVREVDLGPTSWDVTWSPLRRRDGTIDGVITVALDVTERVETRRRGEAAQERLRAALDASHIGTYRWDLARGRVERDDGVKRLFGAGADESIDAFAGRLHPEDRHRVLAALLRVSRDGDEVDLEYRVVHPDGSVRWVLDKGRVVRHEDGRPSLLVGAVVDITEPKRLATAATEANRAKDEFLAMLGHELRNPLAPIATALHLVRQREAVPSREIEVIDRQVRHLSRLVDDLLDISRVTRGQIELKLEVLRVADVVAKAAEMASPLVERQRHHLALDVPRGLYVLGDPVRLAQVLSNLLTNAARYTAPEGHIAVTASAGPDVVEVRVRDNGRGVHPDALDRIFEPFVRGEAGGEGGLGIGLALSRTLARMHGGDVTAESEGPGRGATFVVRLPGTAAPEASVPLEGGARSLGDGLRVLLVDDNVDAGEMLQMLLETQGHAVALAHDGPSALALARTFRPDVAILDIGLPVMDGFELARRLRDDGTVARRIVALTGYGQEEDYARTRAAGFDAHLVKPVDLDRLSRAILA